MAVAAGLLGQGEQLLSHAEDDALAGAVAGDEPRDAILKNIALEIFGLGPHGPLEQAEQDALAEVELTGREHIAVNVDKPMLAVGRKMTERGKQNDLVLVGEVRLRPEPVRHFLEQARHGAAGS